MTRSVDQRKATEEQAALQFEMMRREARKNLLAYARMVYPTYQINWHHREIAEHLQLAEAGVIERLMIIMPPRAGKSLLASTLFPAWLMGRHPTKEVIASSYASDLSSGFGARVRNIMMNDMHAQIFGEDSALATGSKAKDHFLTVSNGVYRATGVGGGVTGFGAHCYLIDDPVKSREEAESETIREKIWEWYTNDVYTRRMKGCIFVLIGTRWHDEDLHGRLLRAEEEGVGDKWVKLHYPAISTDEHGNEKDLWENEYDLKFMRQARDVVGPRVWQCLYQGDPTPDEGNYFKNEWMRYFTALPDTRRMKIYAASDYAVSEKTGDYTVHLIAGVDERDNIYIIDMWRGQTNPEVWAESFIDLVKKWKPMIWAEERGQIDKAIGPFLNKRMMEEKTYQMRQSFSSSNDKAARARSIQARVSMGKVLFPKHAPWMSELHSEMMKFPAGKNDDMVDCLSLMGRLLDMMATGKGVPAAAEKPQAIIVNTKDAELPPGMVPVTYGRIFEDTLAAAKRQRTLH